MTNSVTFKDPRPCASDRAHILPSTSLGNLALSNICLAMIPGRYPFSAPDFSNSPEYSATLSGFKAGTRIGGGAIAFGLAGAPVGCCEMVPVDC